MDGFASVWRLAWRQPIWCYFTIPAHHIHHVSQTSNTQADFSWNLATMFRQRFKLAPISTRDACVACLSQRTGLIAILWMSCLASPDQMTKDYFSILPLNEAKVKAGSHQTTSWLDFPRNSQFPLWMFIFQGGLEGNHEPPRVLHFAVMSRHLPSLVLPAGFLGLSHRKVMERSTKLGMGSFASKDFQIVFRVGQKCIACTL